MEDSKHMISLLLFGSLAAVFPLYYWSEWDDQRKHAKHSRSGHKAWNTRQVHSHAVKVYDSLTDSYKYISLEG